VNLSMASGGSRQHSGRRKLLKKNAEGKIRENGGRIHRLHRKEKKNTVAKEKNSTLKEDQSRSLRGQAFCPKKVPLSPGGARCNETRKKSGKKCQISKGIKEKQQPKEKGNRVFVQGRGRGPVRGERQPERKGKRSQWGCQNNKKPRLKKRKSSPRATSVSNPPG